MSRPLKPWQLRWMPSEVMTLVSNYTRSVTGQSVVKFHVPKHMNKFEIKEYLEKLYGVDIEKVNTINYLGKVKMLGDQTRGKRRNDFKKAYVYLREPAK